MDILPYIFVGVIVTVVGLSVLARRYPRVDWLQSFRFQRPYDAKRDRHLDTAWMDPADALRRRETRDDTFAEVRERVRDVVEALPQLPKDKKARLRRSSNVWAGVQLIALGITLPFGYYIFSMMMFFSSVGTAEKVLVFGAAAACIALGITAIWRSGKE